MSACARGRLPLLALLLLAPWAVLGDCGQWACDGGRSAWTARPLPAPPLRLQWRLQLPGQAPVARYVERTTRAVCMILHVRLFMAAFWFYFYCCYVALGLFLFSAEEEQEEGGRKSEKGKKESGAKRRAWGEEAL